MLKEPEKEINYFSATKNDHRFVSDTVQDKKQPKGIP